MITVGITGGIGSGKSTVCAVFELLGIPVYYADAEARKILDDPEVRNVISKLFGNEVLNNNSVDRKKLAAIVFNDSQKLDKLNSIVHPAVKQHFADWCEAHKEHAYVLKEAAILFESETYKNVQKIITVTAPPEIKISRVMKRDGVSKEEVEKRMASQLSDGEKIKRSDFVLLNNEEQLLIPAILEIHGQLLAHK